MSPGLDWLMREPTTHNTCRKQNSNYHLEHLVKIDQKHIWGKKKKWKKRETPVWEGNSSHTDLISPIRCLYICVFSLSDFVVMMWPTIGVQRQSTTGDGFFFVLFFFWERGWFICRLMAGFVTISRVKFSHLLNILRSRFKAGARTGVHWETKELQAVFYMFFSYFCFYKR